MSRGARALGMVLAAGLLASCATPRRAVGTLRIECNVPQASVVIDDVLAGRAVQFASPGRAIAAGFHRVELHDSEHFAHYAEITIGDGGAVMMKVDLHPLLR